MTSLPNFSPVTAMSHVEIDQTFEKSMQQLNSSQAYYIFPENAKIINKKGQILEWRDSVDEYLFQTGTTTFQDKNGLQYHTEEENGNSILYVQDDFNVVLDWDYTTRFINTSTGEIYEQCYVDAMTISIEDIVGTFKIPSSLYIESGGCIIHSLNCTLDITHAMESLVIDLNVFSSSTEPSQTGKVLITSSQKEILLQRDLIKEVENDLWLINSTTMDIFLRLEVQP